MEQGAESDDTGAVRDTSEGIENRVGKGERGGHVCFLSVNE